MSGTRICRFHPEVGEQRTITLTVERQGVRRTEDDVLFCAECIREQGKPHEKPEFAS